MQRTARAPGTFGDKCGMAKDPRDWKGQDGFIGCGFGMTITHSAEEKRREEKRRENMWGRGS